MKPLSYCLSVVVLLVASASLHADARSDAARLVKTIAPYVEEHTMVVIHGDLTRADADAWFDFAARIVPMPPEIVARDKRETGGQLRAALQAGVKDIYLVITPGAGGNRGLLPTGYAIVPMLPGADVKAVRKGMNLPEGFGRVNGGDFVFPIPAELAPPAAQSAEFHPVSRPELTTALEAAGDSAVQIVVIPPSYSPKIIEDLMPQFPNELGGGSTKVLTRGISWAAVGLDLPPHPAVRMTIKSADAQAAETLRDKMADLLRMVGLMKEVRQLVPKFDEAAKMVLPKVEGDRLVLTLDEQNGGIAGLVSLLAPPIDVARAKSMHMQSMNNLKGIALAMLVCEEKNRTLPLPAIKGKDGKPLLSWRVYLLPYFDQDELFKQFHLDEPWDSPHNRTLIDKMPAFYRMPMSKTERGRTNYLLPVGGGAVFDADKPTKYSEITDGSSNTLLVVEADDDHAVIWTKPEDLAFDAKDPAKGLGRFFNGGFNAAYCDGSVQLIPWPKDAKEMHRLGCLFMQADNEPVERP